MDTLDNRESNYFFSASTGGFYPSSLRGEYEAAGSWPEDALPISDRWYSYLNDGQSRGKVIVTDEYGQPVLSEPAPFTSEQIATFTETKKIELMGVANSRIQPLQDAVELGEATETEAARLIAWKKYRVLLNRVDTSLGTEPDWPELPEDVA
ncbi:TPA: tail fiber assembly protein [Enterobacter ludwigii]|nr:tail fiber assembly protein [Enterobacter ludwigii]HDR2578456.1 tail fiber assembly protein [Enterobacter ludwigii]